RSSRSQAARPRLGNSLSSRRDIADRLNAFLWAPNETNLRLAMPDGDLKRSLARSIAWSEVVVRGGVEPPTFRFSGVADIQVGACLRSVDGCRCASMAGVGCRRCRQRCRRRGQVIRDVVVPIITRLVTQQGRGEPRRLAGSAVFPGACRLIAF